MIERLSAEEKARIEFEDYTRARARIWAELSDKERREIEEDRKKHPEEEITFEKYEQRFRENQTLIEELEHGKYCQILDGVNIYDLFIDTMEKPEYNYHPHGFNESRIVNLSSSPKLLQFLDTELQRFCFKHLNFRSVSNKRLGYVLQNGTDREDRKTFVSQYSTKALEYGVMPKLLLVYDANGIMYRGGVEGYEYEFTEDPKSLLQCAVRVYLQK